MQRLIRWSGHGGLAFFDKKDLKITTSPDTEDKTKKKEKLTQKKNDGIYQLTITAVLDRRLGDDVQALSQQYTEAARVADSGYLYWADQKLIPANMMLTKADVGGIVTTPTGVWLHCEVGLTFKQCGKYDGPEGASDTGSSSGSGKGRRKSVKGGKPGKTVEDDPQSRNNGAGNLLKDGAQSVAAAVKSALKNTKSAKSVSARVLSDVSRRRSSRYAMVGGGKRYKMVR